MTKDETLADANSCFCKAQPDEPIFVLRAKDPLFAPTLRFWAARADSVHEPEKIASARAIADEGVAWAARRVQDDRGGEHF